MALLRQRSTLAALTALHRDMGPVFQIPVPGFNPIMLVGPEANQFMLVTAADRLLWRVEQDPVGMLLRDGLLMLDGERHDALRRLMSTALHRRVVEGYIDSMWRQTDRVRRRWSGRGHVDMLVEMRRVALLILMDALFRVDLGPDLRRLWPSILKTLDYISPGPWLLWRGIPRPGYRGALRRMDAYLYRIIQARRATHVVADDMLSALIEAGLDDGLIRDQLLTMLIAGHDTSTALLSWAWWLIGSHPLVHARARREVDEVLGGAPPTVDTLPALHYLEMVINETLRLYPPIHLGNRVAATDLEFGGYRIPAGRRVLYSIYLAHRDPAYWPDPERFDPERFQPEQRRQRPAYTFLPFGGGRRNCIGFAFAQVEAKVVLARILQTVDVRLAQRRIQVHMGATLEPRPGVRMRVAPRSEWMG
jgi:cytochrome P450